MDSKTLVVGSLAFDIIFSIPGDFRKSIPLVNGEIRNFNATYIANEKKEHPGGTAGNIAFWLGKQGEKCDIFSVWGKDIEQKGYKQKLEKLGAKFVGKEGEHTAHAYMVSDQLHQQLIIWQPNSYEKIDKCSLLDYYSESDLQNFQFAIFSAGTPLSIQKHLKEFRRFNKKAVVVFDPGQVSQFFTKENFNECSGLSDILVGNNIEFRYFAEYGFSDRLILIETLGADGANIKIPEVSGIPEVPGKKNIHVDAIKVDNVVETTGAGDAFRAGVISSLSKHLGESATLNSSILTEAVKNGVILGAECVKIPSAQY